MSEIEGTTPTPDNSALAEPAGAPQDIQDTQVQDLGYESQIPDKFAGKSAEEIVQSYQELERKLAEQGEELASLRRMPSPQYPAPYGQPGYPPPPGYPVPGYPPQYPSGPPPQKEIKWNWDNPTETARELIRSEFAPMISNFQTASAKSLGEVAMANAKTADPALFNGVETEVRSFMTNMIDNGVLRPDSALNPETWRMAAWQMQGMKSGYRPRPAGVQGQPISSVRTEVPGARPPLSASPGPAFSEPDRRMLQKMGLTEEQARKSLAGRR